ETRIHGTRGLKALEEESGADQSNYCERYLGADQQSAQTLGMNAQCSAASALLERFVHVGSSRLHSRNQAGEDCDEECQRGGVGEYLTIERRLEHRRPGDCGQEPADRAP